MPDVTPNHFGHENKSPSELEQRRREIVAEIQRFPKSYDDPDIPMPLLQELSLVTGMLRRRTAGPPKEAKPRKSKSSAPSATLDDIEALL